MEERRVGEYAIKSVSGQVKLQEILLPHFAAAGDRCHVHKLLRAVQPNGVMPVHHQRTQISPWSTTEIKYPTRRWHRDMTQQCINVLAHVVMPCALTKTRCTLLVVLQSSRRNICQWIVLVTQLLFSSQRFQAC